jgi:hypothetical protein
MNPKSISIINFVVVLAVIFCNYYFNAIGINGNTVGSLSDQYDNLFTPAGYAFAIWGLIFLSILVQAIFFLIRAFRPEKDQTFIRQIGLRMAFANVLNIAWLFVWLNELTGVSVVIMLAFLITLTAIILRLNMERWDAPLKVLAFVWWPICLYIGWISVATIANISAYLTKTGFTGGPFSEVTWATIMIVVATLLALFMIYTRNMREFGAVVVWALVAIAVRHWGDIPLLQYAALAGSAIILVASMVHASRYKATLPHKKLQQYLADKS